MGEGSTVDEGVTLTDTPEVSEPTAQTAPARAHTFSAQRGIAQPYNSKQARAARSDAAKQRWVIRKQREAEKAVARMAAGQTGTAITEPSSFTMTSVGPDLAPTPPVSAVPVVSPPPVASAPPPDGPTGQPPASFWTDLIDTLKTNKLVDQEMAATLHAQAMKKALRPENEVDPGVSIYNPKGETKYPRPKPTHIFMMGPYPIASPSDYHTVTWTELELLNQLTPGDYQVTKVDGADVKLTIKTEFDSSGVKPYRSTLIMPMADDDQKNSWPPLVQLLTQIVTGEAPMQSYTRYQNKIAELEAKLAALGAA